MKFIKTIFIIILLISISFSNSITFADEDDYIPGGGRPNTPGTIPGNNNHPPNEAPLNPPNNNHPPNEAPLNPPNNNHPPNEAPLNPPNNPNTNNPIPNNSVGESFDNIPQAIDAPVDKSSFENVSKPYSSTNINGKNITNTNFNKDISKIYKDVQKKSWYYCSVNYVVKNGLMKGTSKDHFSPNQKINKSMAVYVLHTLANSPKENTKHNLIDVNHNSWDSEAINWSLKNNIASLSQDKVFGGKNEITKEELVVMLYNYNKHMNIQSPSVADLSKFSDTSQLNQSSIDAFKWAVNLGIISGNNGKLSPKESATRAQFASILKTYANTLVK